MGPSYMEIICLEPKLGGLKSKSVLISSGCNSRTLLYYKNMYLLLSFTAAIINVKFC